MVTPCLYGSFVFDGGSGPRYCKFCVTAVAAHVYASFKGFACLVSDLLSLPTTHLAFTMWLTRGHLPLALLALGLSGSKCLVIGELQPQRGSTMNLLHLTMHGHLSWQLLGCWQLASSLGSSGELSGLCSEMG
jgi:hypothetical protein